MGLVRCRENVFVLSLKPRHSCRRLGRGGETASVEVSRLWLQFAHSRSVWGTFVLVHLFEWWRALGTLAPLPPHYKYSSIYTDYTAEGRRWIVWVLCGASTRRRRRPRSLSLKSRHSCSRLETVVEVAFVEVSRRCLQFAHSRTVRGTHVRVRLCELWGAVGTLTRLLPHYKQVMEHSCKRHSRREEMERGHYW